MEFSPASSRRQVDEQCWLVPLERDLGERGGDTTSLPYQELDPAATKVTETFVDWVVAVG